MTKNSICFGSGADDARTGVYRLNNYTNYIKNNEWWFNPGETQYRSAGTFTWVCPPGVTQVSAVCIGGGGGGGQGWANDAGGSGGLGWKNNISVTPGNSYTVVVGSRGYRSSNQRGGNSYFINTSTVCGGGGGSQQGQSPFGPNATNEGYGGGWSGDGGGSGRGNAGWSECCGAGGYQAQGGRGPNNEQSGGGGGGGWAHSSTHGVGAGGGTGWYGKTQEGGRAGISIGNTQNSTYGNWNNHWSSGHSGLGGEGGSKRTGDYSGFKSGWDGGCGENGWGFARGGNNIVGGYPGGGGGGAGTSQGGGNGAHGAVRIMWTGEKYITSRSFPSTNCQEYYPAQGYQINTGS